MALWIIRHGRLLVYGTDNIYNLQSGDHFGDKSVRAQPGHVSTHTAIAEEDLITWILTREDIESVIGDIDRLGVSAGFVKNVQDKTIRLSDLSRRRVLGQGAFGTVWLVSHDDELFPPLRDGGYLTRDSRMKERKKCGLHGARKGTQFSKR